MTNFAAALAAIEPLKTDGIVSDYAIGGAMALVAIAPDLLSGMGPKGGGTSEFADGTAVGKAIRDLPPDQVTADLNAVADYVSKLPAANSKVAVAGFCWGGTQSFRLATNRPGLAAAFVFYGSGPDTPEAIARIKAPVHGFYAQAIGMGPGLHINNHRKRISF